MKQLIKPLLAVTAFIGLTGIAQADQAPNWNRAGLAYQMHDFGRDTVDGFEVSATKRVARNGLLYGSYSSVSGDVGFASRKLEQDWLSLGVGARQPLADNTDFFAILSYEEIDISAAGIGSFRDTGFGVRSGVRSMLTAVIEVSASLRYLNIDGYDETSYHFGGQYSLSDEISLGLDYSATSGDKMTGLSAYYHF